MSDYAETAQQMAAEYRRLSDEYDSLHAELDALGRTDVPLSDPSHVINMSGDTRDAWFQKHRALMLKERERNNVGKRALNMLHRAERGNSEASD